MAKRKCVICGNYIETNDDIIPYKNRFAHTSCFNSFNKIAIKQKNQELKEKAANRKRKTSKPKAETIKDAVSEEEYNSKINLFNYLRKLVGLDQLPAKVYLLVENYKEKYSYTYDSIHQALIYWYEIKGNSVIGDAIGIVPYIHYEAMSYYESIKKLEEDIKNKPIKNMYNKKVIKISSTRKKEPELLDITDIH